LLCFCAQEARALPLIPIRAAEERSRKGEQAKLFEHRDVRVIWRPPFGEHRRGPEKRGSECLLHQRGRAIHGRSAKGTLTPFSPAALLGCAFSWLLLFAQAKRSDPPKAEASIAARSAKATRQRKNSHLFEQMQIAPAHRQRLPASFEVDVRGLVVAACHVVDPDGVRMVAVGRVLPATIVTPATAVAPCGSVTRSFGL